MMTAQEVAERLRCSLSLVYSLCQRGKLKHHRLGLGRGTIRVTEAQLAAYLGETAPASPPPPAPRAKPVRLKHLEL